MSITKWTVMCEMCGNWHVDGLATRSEAIVEGHEHAASCEESVDEYQFRVVGMRN